MAARITELTEELNRERIESANRLGTVEARLTALEAALVDVDELRSQRRDDLAQIRQALAAHRSAIDATAASIGVRD